MNYQTFFILASVLVIVLLVFFRSRSRAERTLQVDDFKDESDLTEEILRKVKSRRDYYRDVYLKSDAWKRKRYVVLKRDNWRCVHCGARATQVHHKHYAPRNIGREPIKWLESVCKDCHESLHH